MELSAREVRRALLTVAVGLAAVSLAARLLHPASTGFVHLFDLDAEENIPTWYSSFGMGVSFLLLAAIAWIRHRSNRREQLGHWIFLSATFACLSAEEIIGLHEALGLRLHALWHLTGFFAFAWVIPAGAMVFLFALAYARFLAALPPASRRQFLVAGGIYVLGALGMEMVGGEVATLYTRDSLAYLLACHLEEFLELGGIALFNAALIEYLAVLLGDEGLRVRMTAD